MNPAITTDITTDMQALWFDGRSSRRQLVAISADADGLTLQTDGGPRRHALADLQVAEDLPGTPLPVQLPDGGTLWLGEAAAPLRRWLLQRERPRQRVARLIASWPAVLACTVLLVALLVWFDRTGAGLLGDAAVRVMPQALDRAVGQRAQQLIGRSWLVASQVPAARQRALSERFRQVAARVAPGVTVELRFHRIVNERGLEAGFNAFALPDGTIYLLDGLCEALSDDELLAVLGHELGHVVHRDVMRSVARSISLFGAAGAVLGDFSGVLASGVSMLQTLRYSRDAERAADAYARDFVRAAGLPDDTLLAVWRAFAREEGRRNITGLPTWLSTHPDTGERLQQADKR